MDSNQRRIKRRQIRQAAATAVALWYCSSFLRKTPKHDSVLSGEGWVSELIVCNCDRALSVLRMDVPTFLLIVDAMVSGGSLKATRNVPAQCATTMFLFFVGQRGPKNRALQERFLCSGETITRHSAQSWKLLPSMAPSVIKMPTRSDPVLAEIRQSRKFCPYFKNCRGAVDGTHIPVHVSEADSARFMGRKGITMNVLAACSVQNFRL